MSGREDANSIFGMQKLVALLRDPSENLITLAALVVFGFGATLILHLMLVPHILHLSTWDVWFDSDPPRVLEIASSRTSFYHWTTNHHPLYSMLVYPPVFIMKHLGIDPNLAFGLLLSGVAAAWIGAFHYVVSSLGLNRLQSILVTLLAAGSASVMFWFPVPETFSFGALSIIIVIAMSVWAEQLEGRKLFIVCVAAGVIALSMTSTNWSAALAMAWVFLGWRKAALAAACSLGVTLVLWGGQHLVFPTSKIFFDVIRPSSVDYLFHPESGGMLAKFIAFFFHSVVAPAPGTIIDGTRLSMQNLWPGQGSALATIAVTLWTIMLGLGFWNMFKLAGPGSTFAMRKTLRVILLAALGQMIISVAFGLETFLYSAHYGWLLVLIGAMSLLSPLKRYTLPLLAAVFATTIPNNFGHFTAADQFTERAFNHEQTFTQMMLTQTQPDELTICGIHPSHRLDPPYPTDETEILNSSMFPPNCFENFDPNNPTRKGWIIWYQQWSIEEVEKAIDRGARYFASPYSYGLQQREDLISELTARYRTVERTPDAIILDLQNPAEE